MQFAKNQLLHSYTIFIVFGAVVLVAALCNWGHICRKLGRRRKKENRYKKPSASKRSGYRKVKEKVSGEEEEEEEAAAAATGQASAQTNFHNIIHDVLSRISANSWKIRKEQENYSEEIAMRKTKKSKQGNKKGKRKSKEKKGDCEKSKEKKISGIFKCGTNTDSFEDLATQGLMTNDESESDDVKGSDLERGRKKDKKNGRREEDFTNKIYDSVNDQKNHNVPSGQQSVLDVPPRGAASKKPDKPLYVPPGSRVRQQKGVSCEDGLETKQRRNERSSPNTFAPDTKRRQEAYAWGTEPLPCTAGTKKRTELPPFNLRSNASRQNSKQLHEIEEHGQGENFQCGGKEAKSKNESMYENLSINANGQLWMPSNASKANKYQALNMDQQRSVDVKERYISDEINGDTMKMTNLLKAESKRQQQGLKNYDTKQQNNGLVRVSSRTLATNRGRDHGTSEIERIKDNLLAEEEVIKPIRADKAEAGVEKFENLKQRPKMVKVTSTELDFEPKKVEIAKRVKVTSGLENLTQNDSLVRSAKNFESVSLPLSIDDYADREWKGNTVKADKIKRGYSKVKVETGLICIRRIRGDNYCALRALLFKALSSGIDIIGRISRNVNIKEVPKRLMNNGFEWLENWSFANRLNLLNNSVKDTLKNCLNFLAEIVRRSTSCYNDSERNSMILEVMNGMQENEIMIFEAVKFLMLYKSILLYEKMQNGEDIGTFQLLFARDTSMCPETFMKNHLNCVGDTGGLDQLEMMLLGETLNVVITVFRLHRVDDYDFAVKYPNELEDPEGTVSLVAEDDRHYNALSEEA